MLTRPLRLLFNDPVDSETGGEQNPDNAPAGPETPPAPPAGDTGFPAGTAWQDMTPEQQVAYWKSHSRKHEKDARERATELEQLRQQSLSDEEKRLEEVRRQGEQSGAAKFLGDAVHGHLRALTGKSDSDVADALAFVDVSKFLAADGSLDKEKVTTFSKSLGSAGPAAPAAPVSAQAQAAALLGRSNPNDRSGGSINARRKELRDQYRGN